MAQYLLLLLLFFYQLSVYLKLVNKFFRSLLSNINSCCDWPGQGKKLLICNVLNYL